MKLWIDNVKPAPDNETYFHVLSVEQAIGVIEFAEKINNSVELIDIGHDAGKYVAYGGHYIRLLEWLEGTGRNYPIHIHSDNQINLLWMREIIERNGWKVV